MERKLVGEYLIEWGKLQPDDLAQALSAQASQRDRSAPPLIGEILVEMGVVDRDDILAALAQQEFARMGFDSK